MRTQSLITVYLLTVLMLTGCQSSIVEKKATGLPYEVAVVMKKSFWEEESGKMIKEQLNSAIPALPQVEAAMRVTYVPDGTFNGLLKYVRNILIVDINASQYTKVSLSKSKDEWATGQEVIRLTAPSSQELVAYLTLNESEIVNHFCDRERDRRVAILRKNYSQMAMEKVQKKFGLELKAPEEMTYFKDTTDFLWVSNNANRGRMDMLVYTFPYNDKNTFTQDYLVAKRDSVLKENMPGGFPDSYMTTEQRFYLSYEPITLNNQYCGVLRGLWKMVGDKMGGPFVSHAFLDEKSQRVVVTEAFVYAPEMMKRNLIRKVEAALYTARLQ